MLACKGCRLHEPACWRAGLARTWPANHTSGCSCLQNLLEHDRSVAPEPYLCLCKGAGAHCTLVAVGAVALVGLEDGAVAPVEPAGTGFEL